MLLLIVLAASLRNVHKYHPHLLDIKYKSIPSKYGQALLESIIHESTNHPSLLLAHTDLD